MKVAEISTFAKFSVGKIMKEIATKVNEFGECKIFYARDDSSYDKSFKYSTKINSYINGFVARIFDNDGFCLITNWRKLKKELDTFNPDIIHIHCLHGYHMNVSKLFDYIYKNKSIKVIWTMHDAWAITGHCCYFSNSNCNKWIDGCNHCTNKHQYPSSFVFDFSKHNYKKKKKYFTLVENERMTIVSPSEWLNSILSQSFLKKYDRRVIYNGIDLNKFNKPLKKKEKNNKVLLAVASVWDERKGLDYVLKVSEILSDNWEVVIVGKFKGDYKLNNNVIHIERTDNVKELVELYANCNVFVNFSKDDNYPTVNIEAQSCGAKVLCFDTGGCLETNCGNLYVTSEKIQDIMNNIDYVDNCDLKDIDYNKIDSSRMANEYLILFNEVLNEKNH